MKLMNGRIETLCGDITTLDCGGIVNAANSGLMGGGGVDGAIHAAAGPSVLEACRKIRKDSWPDGLPAGKAVATGAGRLKADYVIHTVGPVWHGGSSGEAELLSSCYKESLSLARELGLKDLAFPAISTGVYGYPRDKAAETVIRTLADEIRNHKAPARILLVFFSPDAERSFCETARRLGVI